jgi:hypothetical protein
MRLRVSREYISTEPPTAEAHIKIQEEESGIFAEKHDIGWSRSGVLSPSQESLARESTNYLWLENSDI